MDVVLVATTHWDREWYRTFQAFRARLVDTIDIVLDLMDDDDGYTFLLDGQSIVLEDYLELRPDRRGDLERLVRAGRIGIGPWYVQPDSLLPSGEAHIRNLLEGRRVAGTFGACSRIAYTPDSFGHPAQFPQLFRGFGLDAFVYWRGNGDELTELPSEYAWTSPDGTAIRACHLWKSYSNAAGLPSDTDAAVARLRAVVEQSGDRTKHDRVLLLAGTDHQLPEQRTRELAGALSQDTGWTVTRGLLEDFVDAIPAPGSLPEFRGELLGGLIANLLPGVWSTRTYLKLHNRRCETALEAWAEPWTALGTALGTPDERPSLRAAWRALLANQAHDSICGCSQDAVHEQMLGRYATAAELADQTTSRTLERLAGLGAERRTPWSDDFDIAVFNPSPHARTDVVRFAVDGYPPFLGGGDEAIPPIHPMIWANLRRNGFDVDGSPARVFPEDGGARVQLVPGQDVHTLEFVARDVPAFGWKRMRVRATDEAAVDEPLDGQRIEAGEVSVEVNDDGTLDVAFGGRVFRGLCALEDTGDRGDTYDYDPVTWDVESTAGTVAAWRHPSGIQHLELIRTLMVPALGADRTGPDPERRMPCEVRIAARVAPDVDRVDLWMRVHNRAPDHRLRLRFPTGAPAATATAAATLDVAERPTARRSGEAWLHPAPATFPIQGWVSVNGLTVVAPGLNEAEVTPDGDIAITLLRATGWLSRMDLATRPGHAGPGLPTPGAQCVGTTEAFLSLLPGADPRAARDAETGLRAHAASDTPILQDGHPLLSLEPRALVLSALKPADGSGDVVLRVLNPTDDPHDATVELGFAAASARSVRLDETPSDEPVSFDGSTLRFPVPPRALRTVALSVR